MNAPQIVSYMGRIVLHVSTVVEYANGEHQRNLHEALKDVPPGWNIAITHSVAPIDLRGDYMHGIGSGWVYSSVIVATPSHK